LEFRLQAPSGGWGASDWHEANEAGTSHAWALRAEGLDANILAYRPPEWPVSPRSVGEILHTDGKVHRLFLKTKTRMECACDSVHVLPNGNVRHCWIPSGWTAFACLCILLVTGNAGATSAKSSAMSRLQWDGRTVAHAPKSGPLQYSIGEPTDEEQYCLELINWARARPVMEAMHFYTNMDVELRWEYTHHHVDLRQMTNQFAGIPSCFPLAFNASLQSMARQHAGYMFANNLITHYEIVDGISYDPASRVVQAGYLPYMSDDTGNVCENLALQVLNPALGHASFEVDWADTNNPPAGYSVAWGILTPPLHRENIHDWFPEYAGTRYAVRQGYQEIGIGITVGVPGEGDPAAPESVVHNIGWRTNDYGYVTGVAYYDLNGNGAYDMGEGLGGVRVTVDGAAYYAVTSESGGYAIPLANAGSYTVRMSGSNLPAHVASVVLTNYCNARADYIPRYTAPVIRGPESVTAGASSTYAFNPVGGGASYQWRWSQTAPCTNVFGAENGFDDLQFTGSTGYSVIVTNVKRSGLASFHFAHPQVYVDQYLTWKPVFRARTNASISFAAMTCIANTNQVARMQISTNSGLSWNDLWTQKGVPGRTKTTFTQYSVSLTNFVGREFLLRCMYDFLSTGGWYTNTTTGYGFYLDDVCFTNVDQLGTLVTNTTTGTNFVFVPTNSGSYFLRVRPKVSNRILDYGPELVVTVTPAAAVRISNITRPQPQQMRVDFSLTNGNPATSQLWWSDMPCGSWNRDPGAILGTNRGSYWFLTTNSSSVTRFYRIRLP
jgi:hypothetical protein